MSTSLILASSSTYRKKLLTALGLHISSAAPNIDETPLLCELPRDLAERLAQAKAKEVAKTFPKALIIGSDQTASVEVDGKQILLGKPGNFDKAKRQLTQSQGKTATFFSAVCLYQADIKKCVVRTEITKVKFRQLNERDINNYLQSEQPYDCAGSFKAESKGILLFDSLESRDPNALIGMPLILLREMLTDFDIDLLAIATQADV